MKQIEGCQLRRLSNRNGRKGNIFATIFARSSTTRCVLFLLLRYVFFSSPKMLTFLPLGVHYQAEDICIKSEDEVCARSAILWIDFIAH